MELDFNTLLAIISLAIAIIITVVGACWKLASQLSNLHKSVCRIATDMSELKGGLVDALTKIALGSVDKNARERGNPLSQVEWKKVDFLIAKGRKEKLKEEEASELRVLLMKHAKEKKDVGFGTYVAIELLVSLLQEHPTKKETVLINA